jgi:hypothetical protein
LLTCEVPYFDVDWWLPHTDVRPGSLNVGCNRISSTAALQALPALHMLALHSNAIAQPSAVLLLSSLTSLQHLTLARNPVCQHSSWQEATIAALPALQVGACCTVRQQTLSRIQLQLLAGGCLCARCSAAGSTSDTQTSFAPTSRCWRQVQQMLVALPADYE